MLGLCSLGLVVVRVLMVVCRSAGGWFGCLGCALWVLLWCGQGGYTCFYLASYNCFLWIPKVTGGTFFGFVFGFVFYSFWACAYGGLL